MIELYTEKLKKLSINYYSSSQDEKKTDKYKKELKQLNEQLKCLNRYFIHKQEKNQFDELKKIINKALTKVKPKV